MGRVQEDLKNTSTHRHRRTARRVHLPRSSSRQSYLSHFDPESTQLTQ